MRPLPIEVAVTIVRNEQGQVLLAQRKPGQIAPGYWELPGGKVDPGETPLDAAARELAEEVGLSALRLRPWISYVHHYRTASVRLHFAIAEAWTGTAHGREGQRIAWVEPGAPNVAPVLPSNRRVMTALGLPPFYATTRGTGIAGWRALAQAAAAGVRLIQLCELAQSPDQRVAFARRAAALLAPAGVRLVLNGSPLQARRAGLDALHSGAAELHRLHDRPPVALWIASCHDEADLARASQLGADAAVLSPVLPSDGHPNREPLGWNQVARLAASARLPVYCAGGLTAADVPRARASGALGVCAPLSEIALHKPGQAWSGAAR